MLSFEKKGYQESYITKNNPYITIVLLYAENRLWFV